jgi:hypothetical protein
MHRCCCTGTCSDGRWDKQARPEVLVCIVGIDTLSVLGWVLYVWTWSMARDGRTSSCTSIDSCWPEASSAPQGI